MGLFHLGSCLALLWLLYGVHAFDLDTYCAGFSDETGCLSRTDELCYWNPLVNPKGKACYPLERTCSKRTRPAECEHGTRSGCTWSRTLHLCQAGVPNTASVAQRLVRLRKDVILTSSSSESSSSSLDNGTTVVVETGPPSDPLLVSARGTPDESRGMAIACITIAIAVLAMISCIGRIDYGRQPYGLYEYASTSSTTNNHHHHPAQTRTRHHPKRI